MQGAEDLTVVSHEQDGRILSGVGVDQDDLAETMERHAPPEPPPAEPVPASPETPVVPQAADASPDRNPDGTFKKTRGQKRFDALTGEREAAIRRAEAAEKEREDLRKQLEDARRPYAPRVVPEPAKPETPKAAPTRTKPTEAEIGTKYQSYADFVEDLADWKSEQKLAALDFDARIRTSIEADRASRTFAERESALFDAGRKVYTDFDAVLKSPVARYPVDLLKSVATWDGAEHILYQLAKDPEVAKRITGLLSDPLQLGVELAKLKPAAAVVSPASTARTMAPPPAPYQPVGGGSKTTVPSSAELAAGHDFDRSGYRERRAAERGVNRR